MNFQMGASTPTIFSACRDKENIMKFLSVFFVLTFLWMSATLVTDAVWDGPYYAYDKQSNFCYNLIVDINEIR